MKTLASASLLVTALLVASVDVADADTHADPDTRSPAAAIGLSIAGTATSAVVIGVLRGTEHDSPIDYLTAGGAASAILLPSLGQFYSGKFGSTGLLVRAAGAGMLGLGVGCSLRCGGSVLVASLVGGTAAIFAGTLMDIIGAGASANEWNAKHALTVAPTAISSPAGNGVGVGLGLGGRF